MLLMHLKCILVKIPLKKSMNEFIFGLIVLTLGCRALIEFLSSS